MWNSLRARRCQEFTERIYCVRAFMVWNEGDIDWIHRTAFPSWSWAHLRIRIGFINPRLATARRKVSQMPYGQRRPLSTRIVVLAILLATSWQQHSPACDHRLLFHLFLVSTHTNCPWKWSIRIKSQLIWPPSDATTNMWAYTCLVPGKMKGRIVAKTLRSGFPRRSMGFPVVRQERWKRGTAMA